MRLTSYLRKGIVYIPTLGMMDRGFYRHIEPVAAVPVFDREALRNAFRETVARGNPLVPKVTAGDSMQQPVLKYAGMKSWAAFAISTIPVGADENDGIYRIIGKKKRPDRGWQDDPEQTVTLPAGSTVDDLCDRLIETIQAHAAQS